MNEATSPDAAKELLIDRYGYDEDDVVAGGDFITVDADEDANNPFGGVLYAVNDIGWRVVAIQEHAYQVMAQPVSPGDAPGWMRLTTDRVARRGSNEA
jgi:hypothetical protein